MAELLHEIVAALAPVPLAQRAAILAQPAAGSSHAALMAALPAFRQVELGGAGLPPPPGPLRIAAWNLERCLFPSDSAALLRQEGVALALLSELDHGCHRTGQMHTTRLLAGALGHRYAFGLEFLELATMPAPVDFPGNPGDNTLGLHGNGFTSALPFRDARLIRLDPAADWFEHPKGGQKRVGGRMALAAIFRHGGQEFLGCSVHLESNTDAAGRDRQMRGLLEALDTLAGDLPVVLGGDLNTPVAAGGHEDPAEALFATARRHGYAWAPANLARPSTRPSRWSAGAGAHQLDWFCTRGCTVGAPRMLPALAADGTVLSDHDLITLELHLG